jgi:hypothetical protein
MSRPYAHAAPRRECLKQIMGWTGAVILLPAAFFASGCGSGSASAPANNPQPGNSPPAGGNAGGTAANACAANGTVASVGGDPLHMLMVPKADVVAGADRSYHIQGRQNHDHVVTLTARDFAMLQRGESISVDSGPSIGPVATHFHVCEVACAGT